MIIINFAMRNIILSVLLTANSINSYSTFNQNPCAIRPRPLQRKALTTPISLSATSTKSITKIPTTSPSKKLIDIESLNKLRSCKNQNEAKKLLENSIKTVEDKEKDKSTILFNSISIPIGASTKRITDTDLAIQTNIRNIKVMDLIETNGDRDVDRASLALFCLFIASTYSAISIEQVGGIPQQFEIIRFLVVWFFSFLPLFFVGAGLAIPNELQGVLVYIQRLVFDSYKKRMIHHEAGHFLLGYLLGVPIKKYETKNAMKVAVEFFSMKDDTLGSQRANMLGFDKPRNYENNDDDNSNDYIIEQQEEQPYFSEKGKGKEDYERSVLLSPEKKDKLQKRKEFLSTPSISKNNPKDAWPYRGLDSDTMDKLSIISVGGICAELLSYGNAEGGYKDLQQLRQFFINYNDDTKMDDKEMENRIKYGISYGIVQLRRHLGALDELISVMERGGTVQECIVAIENCDSIKGIISEEERRKDLTTDVTLVEEVLLYGGKKKNADMMFDNRKEGIGGGDVKNNGLLNLSGDDPFYAAIAVAIIFLLWASNGGLSLH